MIQILLTGIRSEPGECHGSMSCHQIKTNNNKHQFGSDTLYYCAIRVSDFDRDKSKTRVPDSRYKNEISEVFN